MTSHSTTNFEIMGITVTGLPLRGKGKNTGVHADDLKIAEYQVAHVLIEQGYPLRGEEVRFLRKLLGLSLEKFAAHFGMTGSGVRKWEEEKRNTPLEVMTQIALRVFFATKLGVTVSADFSSLRGKDTVQKNVVIQFSQRPFAA